MARKKKPSAKRSGKVDAGRQDGLAKMQAALRAGTDRFRQVMSDLDAEWNAKYGRPLPATMEEWEQEATRAGVPVSHLLNDSWTARSVAPYIAGHLQRLQDETKVAALRLIATNADAPPEPPQEPYLGITLDADKITRDGKWFRITPQQHRICKALFEAREAGLSVDALADKVWETRPESSRNSLDNRTRELNDHDKLLRLGLTILKNNRGIWSLATI